MRIVSRENISLTLCGASLIGHYFALTAAHCGADTYENVLLAGSVNASETQNMYSIAEVYDHPRYDYQKYQYDIALICINVSVKFSSNIKPIKIPDVSEDFVNRSAVVVGSGFTDGEIASNYLRKLNTKIIPIEQCREGYTKVKTFIKKGMHYCILDHPTDGTCSGDSGGPLVYMEKESTYLLGIVSFGTDPCGTSNTSDVFTNIKLFNGTFDEIMKNYIIEKNAEQC